MAARVLFQRVRHDPSPRRQLDRRARHFCRGPHWKKTDRVCVILQTAAAPVAATLLLGGTVLYPRAAFAEAPESYVS